MNKLERTLQIIRSPSIGPITFYYLQNKFNNNLDHIVSFLQSQYKKKLIAIEDIYKEIENTHKVGADFIITNDIIQEKVFDLPPVLVYKGNIKLLQKKMVAVVGTRNSSVIGNRFCKNIVVDLVKKDCVIVSGLALGIDTVAHVNSLTQGTIALLPGDINTPYPNSNSPLFHSIGKQGLLLTQQPLGTQIALHHFPVRNKLIASLVKLGLIIESGLKSGALDTAKKLLSYKKNVYVVPGHPYEYRYMGNNHLLKQGCNLLTQIEDINLNRSGICEDSINTMCQENYINQQEYILHKLTYTVPVHIDDLSSATNIGMQEILCIIGKLVLEDKVIIDGQLYILRKLKDDHEF